MNQFLSSRRVRSVKVTSERWQRRAVFVLGGAVIGVCSLDTRTANSDKAGLDCDLRRCQAMSDRRPFIPDMRRLQQHVSFVPDADMSRNYLITSSARFASIDPKQLCWPSTRCTSGAISSRISSVSSRRLKTHRHARRQDRSKIRLHDPFRRCRDKLPMNPNRP